MRCKSAATATTIAALAFVSKTAFAGNGIEPRTPVQWEEPPCMLLADREATPVLNLPYAIPFEDTDVTADEVEGSRTHQFFAFCRQHVPEDFLPVWVTNADVMAAIDAGLIDPELVTPNEVFETSTAWTDCWFRINTDADRRPITFEMADAGVDWDLTTVEPGVYAIEGYTYEPAFNIYAPRSGVVKVFDGDPAAVGPAAAIDSDEQITYAEDPITVEACVDAVDGTTFTASWAVVQPTTDEFEWIPFAEGLPIDGDTATVDFAPPDEVVGASARIRLDFEDPMGRTYTAFMREAVIVLPGSGEDDCDEQGGGFIGTPGCDESSTGDGDSGSTTVTDDATTSDDGAQDQDDDGDGGRCSAARTDDAGSRSPWLLAALIVLRRRRWC